jgi:hypothetical protein
MAGSQSSLPSIYTNELTSSPPFNRSVDPCTPNRINYNNELERSIRDILYIWNPTTNNLFLQWWSQTVWFLQNIAREGQSKININWVNDQARSDVWTYFAQGAVRTSGHPKVICKRCDAILTHPNDKSISADGQIKNRTGTTPMRNHLKAATCKTASISRGHDQISIKEALNSTSVNRKIARSEKLAYVDGRRLTTTDFRGMLYKMVVSCGLPFTVFDNTEMQRAFMCLTHEPLHFPGASAVRDGVIRLKDEAEEALKNRLTSRLSKNSRISLALDGWSMKVGRLSFLGIIGYWIDDNMDWHDALLGFTPTEGHHLGVELAKMTFDRLVQLGIGDRISSVTGDNVGVNDVLVKELNKFLNRDDDNIIYRFPCLAHVIQLAQGDLLKGIHCSPTNDEIDRNWDDTAMDAEADQRSSARRKSASSLSGKQGVVPTALWRVSNLPRLCDSLHGSLHSDLYGGLYGSLRGSLW